MEAGQGGDAFAAPFTKGRPPRRGGNARTNLSERPKIQGESSNLLLRLEHFGIRKFPLLLEGNILVRGFRHGQHRGLDRNQQFQADRLSVFGVKICSVARGYGRDGKTDRGSNRGPLKPGYCYEKAGVTFIDLVSADRVQAGLFDHPDDARSMARMTAIDVLNARYGRGAVAFGTARER